MELAGKESAVFDCRVDAHAVFGAGCNVLGTAGFQIIGMDKIDVTALGNACKKKALPGEGKVVPADLGNLPALSLGDTFDLSGKKGKSLDPGALFALFKNQLQTQADSQERNIRIDSLTDGILKTGSAQTLHSIAEGTDAGKNDMIRSEDLGGIRCHLYIMPEKTDSILNTLYISRIIINNCYHI